MKEAVYQRSGLDVLCVCSCACRVFRVAFFDRLSDVIGFRRVLHPLPPSLGEGEGVTCDLSFRLSLWGQDYESHRDDDPL
jgi:hypothetical protein